MFKKLHDLACDDPNSDCPEYIWRPVPFIAAVKLTPRGFRPKLKTAGTRMGTVRSTARDAGGSHAGYPV